MRYLFIVFFLFFIGRLHAQPGTHRKDSVLFFSMIDRADGYFEKEKYDSALYIANFAASLAKAVKFYKAQGWALAKVLEVLIELKELDKAEATVAELNKIVHLANDSLLFGVSLMQRGQIKMYNDEPDEAILLLDKSITSGLGKYPNEYLGLAFNDLGYAWGMKDEYERQSQFTLKALGIFETIDNDAGMGMTLGNLSSVYYQIGQKDKAIEYGLRSLRYREKTGDIARLSITCCNLSQYYLGINTDEAAKYQQLCVKYAQQSGDTNRIIHSYITSSLIANSKKNNKEAFDYELKVIDMLERSGSNPRMLARRYIAAAIYTDMLNYDSSATIAYYNKSMKLSKEIYDKANLRDVYLYLSDYHKKRKNFSEAYFTYRNYILYRDSLVNLEKEEMIAELESRYEVSRKDNEIARLNNEQKIKQLEIEKQKAIIAGNSAVALQKQNEIDLLSKSKELQQVRIAKQQEEIEKQMLLSKTNTQQLQIKENENQLRQKQLKSQKQIRNLLIGGLIMLVLLGFTFFNRYQLKKKLEQQKSLQAIRNDISRDLHDDIGASLSNINILNELTRRNISQPEKSKEYLAKASEDIQRISESLSDIVWNINPKYDDPENLFIRMKRYVADMLDGKNINGEFDFPANVSKFSMSMTKRRDLYLIFKEAVNNLVKYSNAANAIVRVEVTDQHISLLVKDDGKGFDRNNTRMGNGLQNMEQRAKAAGAVLKVNSTPGKGTSVELLMNLI